MDKPIGFLESEFERVLAARGVASSDQNVVPMAEPLRAQATLRERERRFRELLDALPAAIYTTDAAGRLTYYNEAAAELWGHRPALGSSEWCGSWKLFWPDGTPLPHDRMPDGRCIEGGPGGARPGSRLRAPGRHARAVHSLSDAAARRIRQTDRRGQHAGGHHRAQTHGRAAGAAGARAASPRQEHARHRAGDHGLDRALVRDDRGFQERADRAHRLAGQDPSAARRRGLHHDLRRHPAQRTRRLRRWQRQAHPPERAGRRGAVTASGVARHGDARAHHQCREIRRAVGLRRQGRRRLDGDDRGHAPHAQYRLGGERRPAGGGSDAARLRRTAVGIRAARTDSGQEPKSNTGQTACVCTIRCRCRRRRRSSARPRSTSP